jgi:hypothetical protein
MQITNLNDYTSSNAMRLIDTSKHLIINTVPYTKDTNSPIPFNNISVLKYYTTIAGHNAVHPQLNCYGDTGSDYTSTSTYYTYVTNKKAVNMIVDSENPDISYVVPSWGNDIQNTGLDGKIESSYGFYPAIYKITVLNDGTLNKEYLNLYSGHTWQGHIYHMTQNNDYVYVLWGNSYTGQGETVEIYKINKKTFEIDNRCYINMASLSTESNKVGSTRRSGYEQNYFSKYVVQVLHENESGFILFASVRCTESNSSSNYMNYGTRIMFYNFETGALADLTADFGDLPSTEQPYGLPTLFNGNAYMYRFSNSSNTYLQECHYIPSKYLESPVIM